MAGAPGFELGMADPKSEAQVDHRNVSLHGQTNSGLADQEVVGHEALLVVDTPPNVTVCPPWEERVDGDHRPILQAGHDFRAERGTLSHVGATAPGNLDMILRAKHGVVAALLDAHDGRKDMPAGRIVVDVGVTDGSTARAARCHLHVRRIEAEIRIRVAKHLSSTQTGRPGWTRSCGVGQSGLRFRTGNPRLLRGRVTTAVRRRRISRAGWLNRWVG
jgi:hypothetical protein